MDLNKTQQLYTVRETDFINSLSVNMYLAEVRVCPAAGWGQWRRAGLCTGPGCRAEPEQWRDLMSSQLQQEQESAQKVTHIHTESFFWDNLITSCTRKPDWPRWMSPQLYSSMTKCCSSQWKLHNTIFFDYKTPSPWHTCQWSWRNYK